MNGLHNNYEGFNGLNKWTTNYINMRDNKFVIFATFIIT